MKKPVHVEDMTKLKPIHINFYSLQRYDKDANFKNVCPLCPDGILIMSRDSATGQLHPKDCCMDCGQVFIYDDIEEVRKRHGWN